MTKVPDITFRFWTIKTMITGACVFWPDYLFDHLGLLPTSGLLLATLLLTVAIQLRMVSHQGWAFWFAMLAVSDAGTEAANGPHVIFGIPYSAAAFGYSALLIVILARWTATEKTLSLRHIVSGRSEVLFWATALIGFALGTAITHLTPESLLQHPALQVLTWSCMIGVLAVARRSVLPNSALPFWGCFVLTRPLGTAATFLLGNSPDLGGLGIGYWPATVILAVGALILVAWPTTDSRDVLPPKADEPSG